ncbi:MAG: tRNA pseudouridine(38-40) synthase TruA, partial [Rhodospirillaceae bacterium]|nr:tRNA pseudouridine(38-40) synthase TruA [Rhodospirillaceae bacterium]
DAGVHALGQVAHVDLSRDWPDDTVRKAVNQHLRPHPIVILDAVRAPDDFHARHDALERSYLYRIANRKAPLALERNRAWYISYPLDVAAMHEAAQVLVGHHDFSTFRDSGCQAKSPLKTLDAISVERHGTTIEIKTSARSFLHRQVRSMVGSLYYVGDGKWSAGGLKDALEARDRKACGVIAPACGLYLETVEYPA